MQFDVEWDTESSIFDNLFNKKKKKTPVQPEEVEEEYNEYLQNMGMD